MIQSLQVGRYYRIKNLRLEPNRTGREFRGRLGGSARLIHLVNPNSSELAEWKEGLIEYAISILTQLCFDAENNTLDAKAS